jgi:hypothetical protein
MNPWEEVEGLSVVSVTFVVESGSAVVPSSTFTSGIATAVVRSDSIGVSFIKFTATVVADSIEYVRYMRVVTKDPASGFSDYV